MVYYESFLRTLEQWGFLDFVLPVLLIFTAVFGILQKLQIFSVPDPKDAKKTIPNKKANLVLALGIALVAVIPHFTGQGPDIVLVLSKMLPNSFVVLIALLLTLLLLGLVAKPEQLLKPGESVLAALIALASFVVLLVIILQAGGLLDLPFLYFLLEPNTLAVLIVILVFALVVWYVSKTDVEKKPEEPVFKGLKDTLKALLGGGD